MPKQHTRQPFPAPLPYDQRLPIYGRREDIAAALAAHQVVVIAGETGSGKTTQLPLICLDAGRGSRGIACTQPRRIAATSIGRYVAQRLGVPLGRAVGYRVRFDQKVSADTVVTLLTDGMLLTDLQHDRMLRRYDTIIIDEAHERSLNIDMLLGYLRRLLPQRPDLKLIISSATIDTALFASAFGNAPIIEVSGRLFPVDIVFRPLELDDEGVARRYIEGAADAVEELLQACGGETGDVLVFMPTQADIAETVDMLRGRHLPGAPLLLPLYGRLPAAEQNRIFEAAPARKIVVATNVAETSITVPGIRFVVDTGLARTVRYVPSLRTSRMPVEPVSRASASQRSGRCGRVQDGICVRLYSQEDLEGRPAFTTPEIRRTNLAGVVLQMEHMGLGPLEEFPFVEPPERRAVTDAYRLLVDLGALTAQRTITQLGRQMALLPLDPHVARMVLQAHQERALREVTIIAAGLSVVDPRERPVEKAAEADAAHKRFLDPMSDFLTYLKLWDEYQGQWDTLRTQSRMRRFCREHFLSFSRMREWHDVHGQIRDICSRMQGFVENHAAADYAAIHRSLLAGLMHNTAMLADKGEYRAGGGRTVYLFPGSSLFRKGHPWVVCHEIVETSRVYGRTAAVIQPEWVEQLAPALCRSSYADAHFDEQTGTVRAFEQVSFLGLPIVKSRPVFYGRTNPAQASRIFVEEGLVQARLRTHHGFLRHNQQVRAEVERLECKLRTRSLYAGDDALAAFYAQRVAQATSLHDLNRLIRDQHGDSFLRMRVEDLLTTGTIPPVPDLPDVLAVGGKRFALSYRFAPEEPDDGITVQVPVQELSHVHAHAFEWALPALWPGRVRSLLEHLPKSLRKPFVPLPEAADRVCRRLHYASEPFLSEVRRAVQQEYGIRLPASSFDRYEPPVNLWPRVSVVDASGGEVRSLRMPAHAEAPGSEPAGTQGPALQEAFPAWQRKGITTWDLGELPLRVEERGAAGGMPLYGYPALRDDGESIGLTVCASQSAAALTHRKGVEKLAELALGAELGWEERDAQLSPRASMQLGALGGRQRVHEMLAGLVRRHALTDDAPAPRSAAAFEHYLAGCRRRLSGCGRHLADVLAQSLEHYAGCATLLDKRIRKNASQPARALHAPLKADLHRLFARTSEPHFTVDLFEQYPRYLAAFARRIETAAEGPMRYAERLASLRAYEQQASALLKAAERDQAPQAAQAAVEFEMMVREYEVSLFAQQTVKTRFPVSEKRLAARLEELRSSPAVK